MNTKFNFQALSREVVDYVLESKESEACKRGIAFILAKSLPCAFRASDTRVVGCAKELFAKVLAGLQLNTTRGIDALDALNELEADLFEAQHWRTVYEWQSKTKPYCAIVVLPPQDDDSEWAIEFERITSDATVASFDGDTLIECLTQAAQWCAKEMGR